MTRFRCMARSNRPSAIMPQIDKSKIESASNDFPLPSSFTPSYGTAGFRAEASLLPSTVFRCGLLSAIR